MMEFTLSRVFAIVCGVMILGTVAGAFTHMTDMNTETDLQELTDSIAGTIERFERSDSDSFTLSLKDVLPNSSELVFDGHTISVEKDGNRYVSSLSSYMGKGVFGKDDIIVFHRTSEGLSVRNIYDL